MLSPSKQGSAFYAVYDNTILKFDVVKWMNTIVLVGWPKLRIKIITSEMNNKYLIEEKVMLYTYINSRLFLMGVGRNHKALSAMIQRVMLINLIEE